MEYKITERALRQIEKRVKRIRHFYNHLQIFIFVMAPILLFTDSIIGFLENYMGHGNTFAWVKVYIWINTLLWFLGLAIHGFIVFKYKINFIDTWERTKVAEYMNKKD